MKVYRLCVIPLLILVYAVIHFGFRAGGDGQLYEINDALAFELHTPNENFNGVTVRSYRPADALFQFICGACEIDPNGEIEMVNVNYRRGDFVYTDFPQHDKIKTDIINLRTGEAFEANVSNDFKAGDDFSNLAEYLERGLMKRDENRLTAAYVRANFAPLSTFTDRCAWIHLAFAVGALLLLFPQIFLWLIEVAIRANDPNDPTNRYGIN